MCRMETDEGKCTMLLALIYTTFIGLGIREPMLGAAWPMVADSLDVSLGSAGLISLIMSGATILTSLAIYPLIRFFGTGKLLTISVAMIGLSVVGFGLSNDYNWMLLLAVPLGLGAGAIDAGTNAFVAKHYEARHMSWLHGSWGLGAIIGPFLIAIVARLGLGWRIGFFMIAGLQLLIAGMLFVSLPKWQEHELAAGKDTLETEQGGLMQVMRMPLAGFTVAAVFLCAATENVLSLWGASYLVQARSFQEADAAAMISAFFIGVTASRFLCGIVAKRLGNKRLILFGVGFALLGGFSLCCPLPSWGAMLSFVLIGTGLGPIVPTMLHQVPERFGERNATAAVGLLMAMIYAAMLVVPPLFGQLFSKISFQLLPVLLLALVTAMLACVLVIALRTRTPNRRSGIFD